ncbi:hypothetical protein [Desulfopila sp. IMCC35008]|uniref:hypothetical protein n=1 Tax=Desulfopila sp. IMCC35008 TaxID=2653858 RepID=UPI0013D0D5F5|nr:hypothetical protein [Desulfopila sp. IMCC35008]
MVNSIPRFFVNVKMGMSVEQRIVIKHSGIEIQGCVSVILVPDIALNEPGYIKTFTAQSGSHSKHEFQAMAQMAYYQYQDDELDLVTADGEIQVFYQETVEEIASGMVIYRDKEGEFHVVIHDSLNKKKMLEATNRYCTRWVRLDI